MVEAFLESIIKGVEDLGWSSSKKIAEHTDWFIDDVEKSLLHLVDEKRILCRKKGRGHQYGPINQKIKEQTNKKEIIDNLIVDTPPERNNNILEKIEKEKITEVVDSTLNISKDFSSIDEFMLNGISALPKDRTFRSDDFAEEMLKNYPLVEWTKEEISKKIAMLVRLKRLELRPFLDGNKIGYEYAVK